MRAFFAIACAAVGFVIAVRIKPATLERPTAVRVTHQPTPLYMEPTREKRLRTLALLGGSSVIAGALIAIVCALVIAIAVGTVTSLLK